MGTKRKTAAPESGAVMTEAPVWATEKSAEAAQAEEPAAVHAAYAGYEETPCVVRAGKGLNLREGPGREFPAAAVLPDREAVNVLGLPYGVEVPGWALVAGPSGFGWVMRDFLVSAGKE